MFGLFAVPFAAHYYCEDKTLAETSDTMKAKRLWRRSTQRCTSTRSSDSKFADGMDGTCRPSFTDGRCLFCDADVPESTVSTQDADGLAGVPDPEDNAWDILDTVSQITPEEIDGPTVENISWCATMALNHYDGNLESGPWPILVRISLLDHERLDPERVMTIKWRAKMALQDRRSVA